MSTDLLHHRQSFATAPADPRGPGGTASGAGEGADANAAETDEGRGTLAIGVVLSLGLLWSVAMCALHLPVLWPPATVDVAGRLEAVEVLNETPVVRLRGDARAYAISGRGAPNWAEVASALTTGDPVTLTIEPPAPGQRSETPAVRVFEVGAGGDVVWSRLRLMPDNARALSFWGSILGAILLTMAAVKGFQRGRFDADTAVS